jgi:hypothetical protein
MLNSVLQARRFLLYTNLMRQCLAVHGVVMSVWIVFNTCDAFTLSPTMLRRFVGSLLVNVHVASKLNTWHGSARKRRL